MNTEVILNDLFSRRTRGIKPGLERMIEAAEKIGNPQNDYEIIHVAGTNGKGSTSTMIASVLKEAGFNVGLFTSPHILEFRERFIVNGEPVQDEEWIDVWNTIQPVCDQLELTFFEISALLAFELFKGKGCNRVVLETGLGGRLDATNICDPILSAITALSVEHTEFLGETIEEIAMEKLGIVKPGKPAVINGNNKISVIDLALQRGREIGSEIIFARESDIPRVAYEDGGQVFGYGDREIFLPLAGDFQQQNCSVAVQACEILGIDRETIVNGLGKTFIPCRLQRASLEEKEYLLDVAHNPQAMEILCSSLSLSEKPHFLIGMMKDKEVGSMVESIISIAESITVISPSISRALSASELGEVVREVSGPVPVDVFESLAEGVANWKNRDGVHVVTGSFFTVSEVMAELGLTPYSH